MAKHSSTATTNLVTAITIDGKQSAKKIKSRARIVWLGILGVALTFYLLDMVHVVMFGFIFEHISELVLTSSVCKFIGE